jgi:hypothetical protein
MRNSFKIFLALIPCSLSSQNIIDVSQEKYRPIFSSYIGIVHPIVTFQGSKTTFNFENSYTVGFPTGIVLRKNNRFAYSFEIIPFIKYQNKSSKVVNILLHPGITFYLKKINLTPRLAFETMGRYGFSFILSKKIVEVHNKPVNIHLGALFRYGLMQKPSQGIALGFSIGL